MDDFLKNGSEERPENESDEGFPVWIKVTGVILIAGVFGILMSEFGFAIILIIWAVVWVFGLLIGKGW